MSNNHEFYLDHKKKQAADGQTDGRVDMHRGVRKAGKSAQDVVRAH